MVVVCGGGGREGQQRLNQKPDVAPCASVQLSVASASSDVRHSLNSPSSLMRSGSPSFRPAGSPTANDQDRQIGNTAGQTLLRYRTSRGAVWESSLCAAENTDHRVSVFTFTHFFIVIFLQL